MAFPQGETSAFDRQGTAPTETSAPNVEILLSQQQDQFYRPQSVDRTPVLGIPQTSQYPPQPPQHPQPPQQQYPGYLPSQANQAFGTHPGYPQSFPAPPMHSSGLNHQPAPFPPQMIQPNFPPNLVPPPAPQYPQVIGVVEGWETGLLDCLDDPTNAITTAFFPCMTFGQIAEIVDEGHTSCATSTLLYRLVAFLTGAPCILSCVYRTKLRNKFALVESPAPDWVIHLLCEHFALCQEYRELKHRGWDPTIGWRGNASRNQIMMMQNQQAAMMPPGSQRMLG